MPIAVLMTVYHFSSGWLWFGAVVFFLCLKGAVMDLQPLQMLVNEAIVDCLSIAHLTMQEAASICGMSEANFYRALSGERYRSLSLAHLLKLPYRFWLHFGPNLMWLVAKKHAQEIADTLSLKRSA